MSPSHQQFAVLQHHASKAFPCKYTESELASFVDRLCCLGHGSVTRHVFDLDGVCHVGEMIPAPADVLKGAAGKDNHGAKAKARPAIRARRHAVQAWEQRCMFIQHPHTHTHTGDNVHAKIKETFSADNGNNYLVPTHRSLFDSTLSKALVLEGAPTQIALCSQHVTDCVLGTGGHASSNTCTLSSVDAEVRSGRSLGG